MTKRKLTKAEREALEKERTRLRENADRTRRLAELAQAKLDAKRWRRWRIAFW